MSGGGRGSGGGSGGGGARVSSSSPASSSSTAAAAATSSSSSAIPANVRKTIQHIKEITGNHSEDEIYSVLKECSMDPNETTQKLLLLDTFHEVKRKRDKKKENANNKESGDSRWKSGTQGRGSRGGRSNYAPRYTSHDAGSGRNSVPGRDSGTNQPAEKAVSPLSAPQEKKEASPTASAVSAVPNGPTIIVAENASVVPLANLPAGTGVNKHEIYSAIDAREVASKVHPIDVDSTATDKPGSEDAAGDQALGSSNLSMPVTTPPSSTVCFSTSDPVLLPSHELRGPGVVGTIKREVGSHRVVSESGAVAPVEKSASDTGTAFLPGKVPNKSQGIGKGHDSSQPLSTSTHGSRPSSNYNSRSQQLVGPQKVGGNKEWKPKPTTPIVPPGSGAADSPESRNTQVEANVLPKTQPDVLDLEEATSKLQKKLEDVHLPQRQHVIIPNHIHVPESERTKLSFGSFDASFGVISSYASGQESEKSSTPLSEESQGEENVEEQTASNQTAVEAAEEVAYADPTQSPAQVLENLSGEADVSSGGMSDYSDSKQEASLSGGQQYSTVHTSPSYNFGLVPPMMGGQVAAFENSDSQGREISRLPNFVVQQPIDPASYYAQYYRSGADSDGRVSPFPSPGVPAKYNGNIAGVPPHTTQSPQEGGNPLVLSTTGPTPLATQAAGLMQSSIAVTQQPLPVFRPPAGLHISHYPPNYIPYGHYFSPFYVPPPGIHQFLSNGAFPQQPQAGGLYPAPPAAAAAGVKYSLPQYKPGTNTGNSTQVGMPSGYVPYGASPGSYNPSSATTGGNTNSNEDLGSSQYKENNVYITGQQSEGSGVWIAAPGRDLSSLPANSFYNIPPQGQHVAFAPTQAGHGAFANMYHPAQAVSAAAVHPLLQQSQAMGGAVDMVGPAANVYQQAQHQQMNWPSNY